MSSKPCWIRSLRRQGQKDGSVLGAEPLQLRDDLEEEVSVGPEVEDDGVAAAVVATGNGPTNHILNN